MDSATLTTGKAKLAWLLAACSLVASCGSTDWIKDRISGEPDDRSATILGAPDIEDYVNELGLIASGNSDAQAEAYADATTAARLTPGPSADLRLGLVLAVPGHPNSDPYRAATLLRGVLQQTELLTQGEISLAQLLLASAESQASSSDRNRNLAAANDRYRQTSERESQSRLATAEAENARLREQLAEAEAKLDALTSIERSIRDRE